MVTTMNGRTPLRAPASGPPLQMLRLNRNGGFTILRPQPARACAPARRRLPNGYGQHELDHSCRKNALTRSRTSV